MFVSRYSGAVRALLRLRADLRSVTGKLRVCLLAGKLGKQLQMLHGPFAHGQASAPYRFEPKKSARKFLQMLGRLIIVLIECKISLRCMPVVHPQFN
jgi:hypothetical protein